jgi:hypothetical protein
MLFVAHVLVDWAWGKSCSKSARSILVGSLYLGWKFGYASLRIVVVEQEGNNFLHAVGAYSY